MHKLYERIEKDLGVDDGIPMEDPNHLGEVHNASSEIIAHLNYLSDSVQQSHFAKSGLDKLIVGMEGLNCNEVSVEALQLLSMTRNSIMTSEGLECNKYSLESEIEGSKQMSISYTIEGAYQDLVQLDNVLREKIEIISNKAVHFYENVLKRTGRVKNRALKLKEKIDNRTGNPSSPRVELSGTDKLLLNTSNTAGSIHTVASVIKSGHLAQGGGRFIREKLGNLKVFTLSDTDGLVDMAKKIPENPLAEIISKIESEGYHSMINDSKEDEEGSSVRVMKSKEGLLGQLFILLNINYNSDKIVTGVNINFSHAKPNEYQKYRSKNETFEVTTLHVSDQIATLDAILETVEAADKYEKDHSKIQNEIVVLERELIRLTKELNKNKSQFQKIHPVEYKRVSGYIQSLLNSTMLLHGPTLMVHVNALDLCDVALKYVEKSYSNTDFNGPNEE